MKTLLIILFLPCVVWAGSETLRPDGDAAIGSGWGKCSGATYFYECISDESDATYDSMYDNNDIGSIMFFTNANTAIADTVIDSVTICVKWSLDNTSNTIYIVDSVAGAEAPDAYRGTAEISHVSAATYTDSVTYTTAPSGEAYTWADIDAYIIGVEIVGMGNNKLTKIIEMWFTTWWTAGAVGGDISYVRRRRIIQGSQ